MSLSNDCDAQGFPPGHGRDLSWKNGNKNIRLITVFHSFSVLDRGHLVPRRPLDPRVRHRPRPDHVPRTTQPAEDQRELRFVNAVLDRKRSNERRSLSRRILSSFFM